MALYRVLSEAFLFRKDCTLWLSFSICSSMSGTPPPTFTHHHPKPFPWQGLWLHVYLSIPAVASSIYQLTPLLPLVPLYFPLPTSCQIALPTSHWISHSAPLLYSMPTSKPFPQCPSLHHDYGGSKILCDTGILQHYKVNCLWHTQRHLNICKYKYCITIWPYGAFLWYTPPS